MPKKKPRGRQGGRPMLGDQKVEPFTVCIMPKTVDAIHQLDKRSLSAVVREVLEKWVKRKQKK